MATEDAHSKHEPVQTEVPESFGTFHSGDVVRISCECVQRIVRDCRGIASEIAYATSSGTANVNGSTSQLIRYAAMPPVREQGERVSVINCSGSAQSSNSHASYHAQPHQRHSWIAVVRGSHRRSAACPNRSPERKIPEHSAVHIIARPSIFVRLVRDQHDRAIDQYGPEFLRCPSSTSSIASVESGQGLGQKGWEPQIARSCRPFRVRPVGVVSLSRRMVDTSTYRCCRRSAGTTDWGVGCDIESRSFSVIQRAETTMAAPG